MFAVNAPPPLDGMRSPACELLPFETVEWALQLIWVRRIALGGEYLEAVVREA
jgi:hypothetical protein